MSVSRVETQKDLDRKIQIVNNERIQKKKALRKQGWETLIGTLIVAVPFSIVMYMGDKKQPKQNIKSNHKEQSIIASKYSTILPKEEKKQAIEALAKSAVNNTDGSVCSYIEFFNQEKPANSVKEKYVEELKSSYKRFLSDKSLSPENKEFFIKTINNIAASGIDSTTSKYMDFNDKELKKEMQSIHWFNAVNEKNR